MVMAVMSHLVACSFSESNLGFWRYTRRIAVENADFDSLLIYQKQAHVLVSDDVCNLSETLA
jgi:hypothetical protein